MNIKIQGHNLKVTEGLEEYALRKIDKLDRYLPNIAEVRMDLSTQHNSRGEDVNIAQITVRHLRGAILRAEEKVDSTIDIAIDAAVDKLYRQIERFKGKQHRKGKTRFSATLEELAAAEPTPITETEEMVATAISEYEALQDDVVVRHKQIQLDAMNDLEAVQQMELLGHRFFMFLNADTGLVNVVYRRDEGNYGVLVPGQVS